MDKLDLKILAQLQSDARIPISEIGRRIGLSQTPCWKRIQRMEEDGIVQKRVAVINPKSIGLTIKVFIFLEMAHKGSDQRNLLEEFAIDTPEILGCYHTSDGCDYIISAVARDMQAYDALYKKLIALTPLKNVTSHFAMEEIKATTALPLPQGSRLVG